MSLSSDPNQTFQVTIAEMVFTFRFPTHGQFRLIVDALNGVNTDMENVDKLKVLTQQMMVDWNLPQPFVAEELENRITFGEMILLGHGLMEESTTSEVEKKRSASQFKSQTEQPDNGAGRIAQTAPVSEVRS